MASIHFNNQSIVFDIRIYHNHTDCHNHSTNKLHTEEGIPDTN